MPGELETAKAILRAAYLRVCAHFVGKDPAQMVLADQEALLARWQGAMEHDLALLGVVLGRARAEGIERVHGLMHQAEGLDHEALDEAVEAARKESTDGRDDTDRLD
jgi:hypothetical protein